MEPIRAVLDDLNSAALRDYLVTEPAAIAALLAELRAARTLVDIQFDHPPQSMITMILGIMRDQAGFLFDADQDPERTAMLTQSSAVAWRALVDGVRIEFVTPAPVIVDYEGRPSLRSPLPEVLLRLQRRNAFRATTPVNRPIHVQLDPDGTGLSTSEAQMLDISALGLCLLVDARNLGSLAAGQEIVRCRFELPGHGAIQCGLAVRYILSAGSNRPRHYRRCGVAFIRLARADEALISRYVIDRQRHGMKTRAA